MPAKRIFIPGSEWIFYKIYSGPKTLEQILINDIFPVVEHLKRESVIDKFFFLRYNDPDYHLRLRFLVPDTKKIGLALDVLKNIFEPYVEEKVISKIMLDSYNREIERYGDNSVELVEALFDSNSRSVLKIIEYSNITSSEERLFWGIKYVDMFLERFGFDDDQKHLFFKKLSDGYLSEFNATKSLRVTMDIKFRAYKTQISRVLGLDSRADKIYASLSHDLDNTDDVIGKLMNLERQQQLQVFLHDLLGSLVHMHYNRLFSTRQRLHELLVYYMSYKAYLSISARKKQVLKQERIA